MTINANPNTQWKNSDCASNNQNFLGDGQQMVVGDGSGKAIYFRLGPRRCIETQEWQNIM